MSVCACTHVSNVHVCIHVCMYVCMYVRMCVCVLCICRYVGACVWIFVAFCMHGWAGWGGAGGGRGGSACGYVYMYVCMYVCMHDCRCDGCIDACSICVGFVYGILECETYWVGFRQQRKEAFNAGWRVGDEVLSVNGQKVGTHPECRPHGAASSNCQNFAPLSQT